MTTTDLPVPFSSQLRQATSDDHQQAERSPFFGALLRGALPVEAFVDMLAQHRYTYAALEGAEPALASDPTVASVSDPGLARLPSLDADLVDLCGPDWAHRYPPSSATSAYVARLHEVAGWPAGFVAHHYTRYLGDLSGGQHIGRIVARHYGLSPTWGGRFSRFESITDPTGFKARYRTALDAAPWGVEERERVVEEIRVAYRLNTEVFDDLARHVA
jgi:heme oxygenase